MKKWWIAVAATVVLAGCASSADEAPSEAPETSAPTTPTASATPSPTASAAPAVDDLYVCEQYMPTAQGESGPIAAEIISTYTSGTPTVAGVEDLYERLEVLESQSSSAILGAVIGVNQPIRYMHEQIAAGNYTFNNQWNALEAMTPLIQSCTNAGYQIG